MRGRCLEELPLKRDILVLKDLQSAHECPVCLVYVLSRSQSEEAVNEFRKTAAGVIENQGDNPIPVALVHEMDYFLPSLGHRFEL